MSDLVLKIKKISKKSKNGLKVSYTQNSKSVIYRLSEGITTVDNGCEGIIPALKSILFDIVVDKKRRHITLNSPQIDIVYGRFTYYENNVKYMDNSSNGVILNWDPWGGSERPSKSLIQGKSVQLKLNDDLYFGDKWRDYKITLTKLVNYP